MKNLFKKHNWNLDTTIPEKERNNLILQMDYDKVKSFLEDLDNGIYWCPIKLFLRSYLFNSE